MKGFYVSANAEGIIAAEIAELAAKFDDAGVVNVSHMPFHVGFIHAFVWTKSARELRYGITWIHLAAELYVLPQQIPRKIYFLAKRASLVRVIRRVVHVAARVPA